MIQLPATGARYTATIFSSSRMVLTALAGDYQELHTLGKVLKAGLQFAFHLGLEGTGTPRLAFAASLAVAAPAFAVARAAFTARCGAFAAAWAVFCAALVERSAAFTA